MPGNGCGSDPSIDSVLAYIEVAVPRLAVMTDTLVSPLFLSIHFHTLSSCTETFHMFNKYVPASPTSISTDTRVSATSTTSPVTHSTRVSVRVSWPRATTITRYVQTLLTKFCPIMQIKCIQVKTPSTGDASGTVFAPTSSTMNAQCSSTLGRNCVSNTL